MTDLADQALLEASRIKNLIAGKPSDAAIPIEVGTLSDVECLLRELVATVKHGAFKRRQRKAKRQPLTSRSKLNRRPDTAYLAFVREHPCCDCGDRYGVEAHHTGGKADKAMGRKPPDSLAVPLCRRCHQHFHDHGYFIHSGKYSEVLTTDEVVRRTIAELQADWAKRQDKEPF